MTARARLALIILAALLGGLVSTPAYAASGHVAAASRFDESMLAGSPSRASTAGGADLVVGVSKARDAQAGKRVTYTVTVRNAGPRRADLVRVRFTTTVPLHQIAYQLANGSCSTTNKRVECLIHSIKSGHTATATISGLIPAKIKTGTTITNTVTVTSQTRLINTGNDAASDHYRLGVPATPVLPATTAQPGNKIVKASNAAAKVFSFSRGALRVTLVVLAAGLLWFGIGLTVRKILRVRKGITNGGR